MSDSPESVLREFLAAWSSPSAENLSRFFNDNAIWVDGPQGIRHGAAEIADVLSGQLGTASDQSVEIDALVANGGLVMLEWHGGFTFNGKSITTAVMAVRF
jgi:limonene-1,2-epoxide hydrolase